MYWSTWDAETNRGLVTGAGLEIIDADLRIQMEDGEKVAFLWVLARKETGAAD